MPAWPYGFLDESTRPDANLQRFGVAEQVESESAQAIPPLTSPLAGRKDNPKLPITTGLTPDFDHATAALASTSTSCSLHLPDPLYGRL